MSAIIVIFRVNHQVQYLNDFLSKYEEVIFFRENIINNTTKNIQNASLRQLFSNFHYLEHSIDIPIRVSFLKYFDQLRTLIKAFKYSNFINKKCDILIADHESYFAYYFCSFRSITIINKKYVTYNGTNFFLDYKSRINCPSPRLLRILMPFFSYTFENFIQMSPIEMPEPHLNIPIVPIDDEIDLSSFDKNCYFIGSQYSLISDLAPDVFESIMFSIGDVIKNPTFFIPHPRSTDNEISKYLKSENLKLLKLHHEYLDQYFLRNKIYPKVIFSFFSTGPILLSKKYPKCNFVLFDIRKYLLKQSIINDNYINYVKSQNNFLVVEV